MKKLTEIIEDYKGSEKQYFKFIDFNIVACISNGELYFVGSTNNNIVQVPIKKSVAVALNLDCEFIEESKFIGILTNIKSDDWMVMMLKKGLLNNQL